MRFLRTVGECKTGIPPLDGTARSRFRGIRHELMPPEPSESLLDRGGLLVSCKGVVDVCPRHAVWCHSTQHLQYLIRERIPQRIPKNVCSGRLRVLPERERRIEMWHLHD